ncbi:YraN family protein [Planotetraspora sp. A-T 1434]|uniref:YraN family protein n=1 Tax=Planotetraspora sp. A-T 1434 TaxID=2979219 RepID=UPI0021C25002|nr:YraN family protein [Planotetraspora sp. A-T 1434]MCT9929215.1 YraN family protein [Planotetraspora sp. A-T 1434]
MAAKDQLGRHGEQLAADYLNALGVRVLDRNWRCPEGEIDIVARDGHALVVVEVKTRSGRSHGTAFEAVTRDKLLRLRSLAGRWLAARPESFDTIRVDVIALERFAGDFAIRHERGVI